MIFGQRGVILLKNYSMLMLVLSLIFGALDCFLGLLVPSFFICSLSGWNWSQPFCFNYSF